MQFLLAGDVIIYIEISRVSNKKKTIKNKRILWGD